VSSPSAIVTGPVRVALVGCGRISRNHLEAIDHIDELQLVAVADSDVSRAQAVGVEQDVPAFGSLDEMLAGVPSDLVAICTPSGLHPQHGIAAARAGRHVLTEKPMAISLAGADDLVQACDAAGVHLFVVKQNRLNPAIQLLRRAVDKGRFGRIYSANTTVRWTRPQEYYDAEPWRGTWEFDGGAIMNQASHYVDLMQWLVGPVESVLAKTATQARRIEAEDSGVALLKFRSGALGVRLNRVAGAGPPPPISELSEQPPSAAMSAKGMILRINFISSSPGHSRAACRARERRRARLLRSARSRPSARSTIRGGRGPAGLLRARSTC